MLVQFAIETEAINNSATLPILSGSSTVGNASAFWCIPDAEILL